jgi:hypothetical protein
MFDEFTRANGNETMLCGGGEIPIMGFGRRRIKLSSGKYLSLSNVVYCPDMPTNLLSVRRPKLCGIIWDVDNNWLKLKNGRHIHKVLDLFNQFLVQFIPTEAEAGVEGVQTLDAPTALPAHRSKKPRPNSKADGRTWHYRIGHAGDQVLEHLEEFTRGAKIEPTPTARCEACASSKITSQVSRRPPEQDAAFPFDQVSIDLHEVEHHKFVRYMLITCRKTNFVLVYFLQTFKALPILHAITDAYRFCLTRFKVRWRKIKSDQELARSALIQIWIAANGIVHEPSAPHTQAQDGHAERSGGVIGATARTMQVFARLPDEVFPEVVEAAVYLHNLLPCYRNNWRSPITDCRNERTTTKCTQGRRSDTLSATNHRTYIRSGYRILVRFDALETCYSTKTCFQRFNPSTT